MIITKKIEVDVPDMHARIRAFLDTVDGVATKLIEARLNPQTVYTFTKKGTNASYWQLDRYLKPLGSSVEALGVVFPSEAQKPLPIDQAAVGEPVLGVWSKGFCSCYINSDGLWFDSAVEDEDTAEDLVPPDGWLPLPVLVEEEDDDTTT